MATFITKAFLFVSLAGLPHAARPVHSENASEDPVVAVDPIVAVDPNLAILDIPNFGGSGQALSCPAGQEANEMKAMLGCSVLVVPEFKASCYDDVCSTGMQELALEWLMKEVQRFHFDFIATTAPPTTPEPGADEPAHKVLVLEIEVGGVVYDDLMTIPELEGRFELAVRQSVSEGLTLAELEQVEVQVVQGKAGVSEHETSVSVSRAAGGAPDDEHPSVHVEAHVKLHPDEVDVVAAEFASEKEVLNEIILLKVSQVPGIDAVIKGRMSVEEEETIEDEVAETPAPAAPTEAAPEAPTLRYILGGTNNNYPGFGCLSGHNDEKLNDVTLEECKEACDARETCKSFDFYEGRTGHTCSLSDSDFADIGTTTSTADCRFYEKNHEQASTAPYCYKIVTGTGDHNDGTLSAQVISGTVVAQVASGSLYSKGEFVNSDCFTSPISSLQVMNPTTNAWAGSVEYSMDGGGTYSAMNCTVNCNIIGLSDNIVVDGNGDAGNQAAVTCLNGQECALIPQQAILDDVSHWEFDVDCSHHEMTDEERTIFTSVIELINESMYGSMDASHRMDQFELEEGIRAIRQCSADIVQRQSYDGDLGGLHYGAIDRQEHADYMKGLVVARTADNATRWFTFSMHMQMIMEPPECPELRPDHTLNSDRSTMLHFDTYFTESAYSYWYTAELPLYIEERDAWLRANHALKVALTAYDVSLAMRKTAYCDWKTELDLACSSFDVCYQTRVDEYLNVLVPKVKIDMEMRKEAFKAGELIIAKVKYLMCATDSTEDPVVDTSRYEVGILEVPAQGPCDKSDLDDPMWDPTIDCDE